MNSVKCLLKCRRGVGFILIVALLSLIAAGIAYVVMYDIVKRFFNFAHEFGMNVDANFETTFFNVYSWYVIVMLFVIVIWAVLRAQRKEYGEEAWI